MTQFGSRRGRAEPGRDAEDPGAHRALDVDVQLRGGLRRGPDAGGVAGALRHVGVLGEAEPGLPALRGDAGPDAPRGADGDAGRVPPASRELPGALRRGLRAGPAADAGPHAGPGEQRGLDAELSGADDAAAAGADDAGDESPDVRAAEQLSAAGVPELVPAEHEPVPGRAASPDGVPDVPPAVQLGAEPHA